jgi:hypothetical protein
MYHLIINLTYIISLKSTDTKWYAGKNYSGVVRRSREYVRDRAAFLRSKYKQLDQNCEKFNTRAEQILKRQRLLFQNYKDQSWEEENMKMSEIPRIDSTSVWKVQTRI